MAIKYEYKVSISGKNILTPFISLIFIIHFPMPIKLKINDINDINKNQNRNFLFSKYFIKRGIKNIMQGI